MHFGQLAPPEQRVLGALIEKRWTTPDQYPLSLNGLRLACNQLTNRDPVTDYDEATVRDAAQRLSRYGLARLASGHNSRASKYRHLAEEALSLGREELAVLAVLLLRGPQTLGELKARTERMVSLSSVAEVQTVLDALAGKGYARSLGRRPGQKEDRFEHLLGGAAEELSPENSSVTDHGATTSALASGAVGQSPAPGAAAHSPAPAAVAVVEPPPSGDGGLGERLAALEAEVRELRRQLSELLAR